MSDQNPPQPGAFGEPPRQPGDPTTPIPPVPQPYQSSQPYPSAAPPSSVPGPAGIGADSAGFLQSLFDFSFTHFVTPKLVKFVYVLATIALAVGWFGTMITAFSTNAGLGLVVLVLGPVMLIIYLALIRMTLEFYLSVVRMSQDIHQRLPNG